MLLLVAILLTSCKSDCKGIDCANGGFCDSDVCNCTAGYEGKLCETESRAKIIGTYSVNENCDALNQQEEPYNVTITKSTASVSHVLISPFCNINGAIGVCLLNKYTLVLVGVSGTSFNFTEFNSAITIDGETISVNYTATYTILGSTITRSCVSAWTKL